MWGRKAKVWPVDPETGLAELPTGFYWEVDTAWISLMQERSYKNREYTNERVGILGRVRRVGRDTYYRHDKTVVYGELKHWDGVEPMGQFLARFANGLRTEADAEMQRVIREREVKEAAKEFVGKYPPKKL